MNKLLLLFLSLLLVAAPYEVTAARKHVVKHHTAQAQTSPDPNCALGTTSAPAGTGCAISDYSVGGALSDANAIAICQQSGGCYYKGPAVSYTQIKLPALASYVLSKLPIPSANLLGGTGSAFSSVSVGSGLSLTGGTLTATGTTLTIPSAQLLGGTGSALTGVSVGTGLNLSGGTLTATGSTGSFSPITIGPGLTDPVAYPNTYNTGTQTVASGGHLSPQLQWESHTSSYTVHTTDSGKLLEASGGGVTFTLPTAGAVGSGGYSFKFAGSAYTVTTQSNNNIYGCGVTSGAGTTPPNSITVNFDISVVPTSNSPNTWACIPNVSQTIVTAPYGPGMNMSTAPIPIALRGVPVQLISVICVPGNVVNATPSYIDLYSCASGVLPGTGSCTAPITTSHCIAGTGAGGGAATTQILSFPAGTTIPGGNIAWAVGSGAGWGTAGALTSSSGLFEIGTSP